MWLKAGSSLSTKGSPHSGASVREVHPSTSVAPFEAVLVPAFQWRYECLELSCDRPLTHRQYFRQYPFKSFVLGL